MHRALFLWAIPEDRPILDRLEKYVQPVAREHGLEIQNDSKLLGGDDTANAMDFVDRATVIVPLISQGLVSRHPREISRALIRRSREEAIVFPVLARDTVRPSAHEQGIFSLVFTPEDRPIARWDHMEEACAVVAGELRKTLDGRLPRIQSKQQPSPHYEDNAIQRVGEALNEILRSLKSHKEREERLLEQFRELQRQMRKEGRLRPGDILSRRFRLLQRTYQDEYSTTWDGWDLRAERIVVVHELSELVTKSGELRERALARVAAVSEVAHPAIVDVVCAREQDSIHDYFVTEALEWPLSKIGFSRRFSAHAVVSLGIGLGAALTELHRRGLVHGAVRPDNVFCDAAGAHKLGCPDLLVGVDTRRAGSTANDAWATAYSAPELLSHGGSHVDERADVFGLAMTLAALLFGADLGRRSRGEIARLVDGLDCGARVKNALRQAISDDPLGRHDTIDAFCVELVAAQRVHRTHSAKASEEAAATLLEMVTVPAGDFEMGGGEEARPHEQPPRRVQVSSFQIGKYPVTAAQYAEVMALVVPPRSGREDWPVTEVSVRDAAEFCNRLSLIEGLRPAYDLSHGELRWLRESDGYRLPLEAEWELAARGADGRTYAWGNDPPAWQLCWDGERPAVGARPARRRGNQTSPEAVGLHPEGASPYGVQDMQGNVWEWCWDWFEKYRAVEGVLSDPAGPDAPEHPPEAPGPGAYRVIRGGSFRITDPSRVRAVARAFDDEIVRHPDIGFRIARGPKPAHRSR